MLNPQPMLRCAASDASCGPQPVFGFSGCYRPSATRNQLGGPFPKLIQPVCRHDGECVIDGCGDVCAQYADAPTVTNCSNPKPLRRDLLCGCVEGYCTFFTQ
jgi:hypothetical protein